MQQHPRLKGGRAASIKPDSGVPGLPGYPPPARGPAVLALLPSGIFRERRSREQVPFRGKTVAVKTRSECGLNERSSLMQLRFP